MNDVMIAIGVLVIIAFCLLLVWGVVNKLLPKAVKREERRTNPCRTCDGRARKYICDGCPVKLRRDYEAREREKHNG